MQKGFYDLTSGMLTQNRILNNISNNLANLSTPGYKQDYLMTSTFDERMQIRTGNIHKEDRNDLQNAAMLRTVDETVTDFTQGALQETGRALDFAIQGDGFFEVHNADGDVFYTRNGSFTLDEEGYLQLQNIGRVIGDDDQEIMLGTDKIICTEEGYISDQDGNLLGSLKLVNFDDTNLLLKSGEGMFINPGEATETAGSNVIEWRMLEDSNANLNDIVKDMITAERAFQSASQILKMYDELLGQTVTEIARLD